MNLGLEYLLRSGLIRELFEMPCSLFLEKEQQKKVAVLMRRGKRHFIQHWNLFQCEPGQALPPMMEYEVEDVFDNPYVVPKGYYPLQYADRPVPIHVNTYRHPMDREVYESFFNMITHSWTHRLRRADWLWGAFLHIYGIRMLRRGGRDLYLRSMDIFREQEAVRINSPKQWKIWSMWLEYLMPDLGLSDEAVPAELVFTSW